MKKRILLLVLTLCVSIGITYAEKKSVYIKDNRGYVGSSAFFQLKYTYNYTIKNYAEVIDGPITATGNYTSDDFKWYCPETKGTRKITGTMKNNLRTGKWTTFSDELYSCRGSARKSEKFTATGNYIDGVPDGEWKIDFKNSGCETYCICTAHFKNGVITDINYKGKDCSYDGEYIVKGQFNDAGFMNGKWTVVNKTTIKERVFDNGKLKSERSLETGTGKINWEHDYTGEFYTYSNEESCDNELYKRCLKSQGGNILADIATTPSVLDDFIWDVSSIEGTEHKVRGFLYYGVSEITRYASFEDYTGSVLDRDFSYYMEKGAGTLLKSVYSERDSLTACSFYKKYLNIAESLKIKIDSVGLSSDGQYYKMDDCFFKKNEEIDDIKHKLDVYIDDLKTEIAKVETSQEKKRLAKERKEHYSSLIDSIKICESAIEMECTEKKEGYNGFFISTSDRVVPKDNFKNLWKCYQNVISRYDLNGKYAQFSETNSNDLQKLFLFLNDLQTSFISTSLVSEITSSNDLLIEQTKQYKDIDKAYNSYYKSINVIPEFKDLAGYYSYEESMRGIIAVQKNCRDFINSRASIDKSNNEIISKSKKFKNISKAYNANFKLFDLTWNKDKTKEALEPVVKFQLSVLDKLMKSAEETNLELKGVKDIDIQKEILTK